MVLLCEYYDISKYFLLDEVQFVRSVWDYFNPVVKPASVSRKLEARCANIDSLFNRDI